MPCLRHLTELFPSEGGVENSTGSFAFATAMRCDRQLGFGEGRDRHHNSDDKYPRVGKEGAEA